MASTSDVATLDLGTIAFVPDHVLEALVALKPVIGLAGIRDYLQATRRTFRRIDLALEAQAVDSRLPERPDGVGHRDLATNPRPSGAAVPGAHPNLQRQGLKQADACLPKLEQSRADLMADQ